MTKNSEFINYLLELLEPMGNIKAKSMFGGHGIYHHDLMFGLVADEELYLKADDINRPAFEDRDLPPFMYQKANKLIKMSYFQAPEEALEDSETMIDWAKQAYAAATRTAKPKKKSVKK